MAMSANAVLMKFFKLPPAMRMILALAGFGSLATILFTLAPALRTRKGQMWILIIGGIGLVLFLLIWGIRQLFFKKKASQLDGALESQGPTRGDVAEQEKIYREKFRTKLADLKTNGLSIYKLPWFALVGEPGCGKTASLIHSGLDFPLGKDEVPGFGGTRNYNWWFTNEAVILDTAGRIAFHEEGTTDKVEWEYFCKLLKQNRPRCPINGMVIAVPADKLLRDSADERQQKATVLRERLRQIHQSLGVRFPTFVLVTKMDLVGGFSEFFEEIRVDLAQRNQMCGWSRPGEFQTPYDPEKFDEAFDEVYYRLRDWGMRYLQRKATEDELGMIVTYPESFRQLKTALGDYVKTIFQKSPLLEPPFFRGFYFTSAVQEGAPILDVLTRTSTHRVSERASKAVDSKAFFIHDFYARKVFPEQGLVFRSAKHVSLNKRMRRMVWVGSVAMLVVMFAFFGFGMMGIRGLVTNPQEACKNANALIVADTPTTYDKFADNLKLAKSLKSYHDAYSGGWNWLYARALFIGANISVPQRDVGNIHAGFVFKCLVAPVLAEAENRFASAELKLDMPREKRERYLAALKTYIQWYGEVVGQGNVSELKGQAATRRGEFAALLAFLEAPPQDQSDACDQFEHALETLSVESRNFGRDVLGATLKFANGDESKKHVTDVICNAVGRITENWKSLADVRTGNTNPHVAYWMEFTTRVAELRGKYEEITGLVNDFKDESKYAEATASFMRLTAGAENLGDVQYPHDAGTLKEAYDNFITFLNDGTPPERDGRIVRLGELFGLFAEKWNAEYEPLTKALHVGAPDNTVDPQSRVYAALTGGETDLATVFRRSVKRIRDNLGLEGDAEPVDVYANAKLIEITERQPGMDFDGKASIKLAKNALGANDQLKQYLLELREVIGGSANEMEALNNLNEWPKLLSGLTASEPQGEFLSAWMKSVKTVAGDRKPDDQLIIDKSSLKDRPFWRAVALYNLADQMWAARRAVTVDSLLDRMTAKADATLQGDTMPGLAQLLPGYDEPDRTLPFKRNAFNAATTKKPEVARTEQPKEAEEQPDDGSGRRRLSRAPETTAPTERDERLDTSKSDALLFAYHTRAFLAQTLQTAERVTGELKKREGGQKVIDAIHRAADKYVDAYFQDWYRVYADPTCVLDEKTLTLLKDCGDGSLSWPQFYERVTDKDRDDINDLADRMNAIVRDTVVFDYAFASDAAGNAALDRVWKRLDQLKPTGRSLPDTLESIRNAARRWDSRDGELETALGRHMADVWGDYVREVQALGTLTDETVRSGSGDPPDLTKLRDQIILKRAADLRFPVVAPLIDIADYGQTLLVHHLDQKLTAVFANLVGKYPIVTSADALDDSASLERVSRLATLPPADFIGMLNEVKEFQHKYAKLYEDVAPDSPAHRTLKICEAWSKFLFDDPSRLTSRDSQPQPLEVQLAVVRPDPPGEFQNAGSVYTELTITLPLLSEFGTPADAIKVDTVTTRGTTFEMSVQEAIAKQQGTKYRWDLTAASRQTFQPTTAVVSGLHPDADPKLYDATAQAWKLPNQPWALLMLLSARADNSLGEGLWKIPVVMKTAREPIGFTIGLRIGDAKRPFPGPIPPLQDAGPRPKLVKADGYLNPKRP